MTTATPSTRVSDLNKIIEAIDQFKANNPGVGVFDGDPEYLFLSIVTSCYIAQAELSQQDNYYLWLAAGSAAHAVFAAAEEIGVKDLSIFDKYLGALPHIYASSIAINQGKEVDVEGLQKYGNTLNSDFFTKENN